MDKIFDVAIIGAGVIGAAIARKLARYELAVVLIDKEADVAFGTSKANSGIVHAGFHTPWKYLKSKLEVQGNLMFDQLQKELDFPFRRCGILAVAFREEELKTVETLYRQGVENGAIGIEICGRNRLLELEPKLNPDVIGGLHAPNGGIVEPYRLVFSLVESARKNGVELVLNFNVVKSDDTQKGHVITSSDGQIITARNVINAAGVHADTISNIFHAETFKITSRKGEEFLLDRESKAYPNRVIFPVPSPNSKGMLVIPTVDGTMMVGPTATETDSKEDFATTAENLDLVFNFARKLIPVISERDIITSFAGLRPALLPGNDFYIDNSKITRNFIQVAGIQSPGLTAAPAIAEYVKDLLKNCDCTLIEKKKFDPFLEKIPRIRNLSVYETAAVAEENPQYANVICRCEKVSEAEIVEAIKRGHTTLDGIKFYTRSGMGRCQGGFCTYKIIKIIMRETGMSYQELTKRGKGSYLISGKLGKSAGK
ncbi:MAG: NAD(P)/FAD-dependent oxidoreductase [Candidatus Ozemobacteraceae bacterium]